MFNSSNLSAAAPQTSRTERKDPACARFGPSPLPAQREVESVRCSSRQSFRQPRGISVRGRGGAIAISVRIDPHGHVDELLLSSLRKSAGTQPSV